MPSAQRIVITGAAGNLGRKLSRHLMDSGRYELCLLDRAPEGQPDVIVTDLSLTATAWMDHLQPGDIVVHLAGEGNARAEWPKLAGPNLDAVLNLYLAAAQRGVRRIVLASSVWVLNGYRDTPVPLRADLPPDPGGNAYGATKLFAERTGRAFALHHGLETVAVRIGACPPRNGRPDALARSGPWSQDCWLSDADFCTGLEAAITCAVTGFAVINLTSRNPRSSWSLSELEALTGFVPAEHRATTLTWRQRLRGRAARSGRNFTRRLSRFLVARDW